MQAPKTQADKDFGRTVSYAYHLDAERLADIHDLFAAHRAVAAIAAYPTTGPHWGAIG